MYRNISIVRDCIIIGAGAAGLTAGVTLARTRRSITIIDEGLQNNKVSHEAHNFFTRDGQSPESLYSIGQDQFLKYPSAQLLQTKVSDVSKNAEGRFIIKTTSGELIESKSILLAQGMTYKLPSIPGLKEIWGTKAWHCPFCHGYEARDKRILIIASPKKIAHLITIITSWSTKVIVAVDENALDEKVRGRIARKGIKYSAPVTKVIDRGSDLLVETEEGPLECDSILVECTIEQRDDIHEKLNIEKTDQLIKVDDFKRTNVQGVYCAGDQQTPMAQVSMAVASGGLAAVVIQMDLSEIEANEK